MNQIVAHAAAFAAQRLFSNTARFLLQATTGKAVERLVQTLQWPHWAFYFEHDPSVRKLIQPTPLPQFNAKTLEHVLRKADLPPSAVAFEVVNAGFLQEVGNQNAKLHSSPGP